MFGGGFHAAGSYEGRWPSIPPPAPEIFPLLALASEAQEVLGLLYGPIGLPEDVARDLGIRGVGEHGLGAAQTHLAQEQTLRLELGEVGEDPRRFTTLSHSVYPLFPTVHPFDTRPGEKLVVRRVSARVPGVEEQTVLVLVANVALQIVAGPGRDRDQAPPAKEPRYPRCVLPHSIHVSGLPTFHSVSFARSDHHTTGYSTLRPAAYACQHFSTLSPCGLRLSVFG